MVRSNDQLTELFDGNAGAIAAFENQSASIEAGRAVRRWRTSAGLTQKALAERLEVTQGRVSAIEQGRGREGPSYATLKRIAAACDVELDLAAIGQTAEKPVRVVVRRGGMLHLGKRAVSGTRTVRASDLPKGTEVLLQEVSSDRSASAVSQQYVLPVQIASEPGAE